MNTLDNEAMSGVGEGTSGHDEGMSVEVAAVEEVVGVEVAEDVGPAPVEADSNTVDGVVATNADGGAEQLPCKRRKVENVDLNKTM